MKKISIILSTTLLLLSACGGNSNNSENYQTSVLSSSNTPESILSEYNDGSLYFSFQYPTNNSSLDKTIQEAEPGEKMSDKTLTYNNSNKPVFKIHIYSNNSWEEAIEELYDPPSIFQQSRNFILVLEEIQGGLQITDALTSSFKLEELDNS